MRFDLALGLLFKGKSIYKGSWGDEGNGRCTTDWDDGRYLKIQIIDSFPAIYLCSDELILNRYMPDEEDLFSGDWYEKEEPLDKNVHPMVD